MKIDRLGLFLTRKCNFRCIYCCTQTGKDPSDKMTFAELQNLLIQAKSLGAKQLVVAGEGEPLFDDNLFPLFEYARKLGMICILDSNISLVNKDIAKWLYLNKVRMTAKLNSLNPETQDILAGKTGCHQWVEYSNNGKNIVIPYGLKNLLEVGYGNCGRQHRTFFSSLLTIETVITTSNIADIPEIVKFCRAFGLGVYIERLLPPTSNTFDKKLIPSKEQEHQLYKEVIHLMDWRSALITRVRCPFETNPFFDINGNILFCFSVDKSVGNIRSTPLHKLHSEQLKLKDKLGSKSSIFRWHSMEFRDCRSRKLLKNELNWQC